MNAEQLATALNRIVALVNQSEDAVSCWSTVLQITGQRTSEALRASAVNAEIDSVAEQLRRILLDEPIPGDVRSLYFGLFDEVSGDQIQVGYYISGWSGEGPVQWDTEEPRYLPTGRYIASEWLTSIKREVGRRADAEHLRSDRDVLDYAVTFGAAAILSKFAARSLSLRLPIFVGFDSGDCARVAN